MKGILETEKAIKEYKVEPLEAKAFKRIKESKIPPIFPYRGYVHFCPNCGDEWKCFNSECPYPRNLECGHCASNPQKTMIGFYMGKDISSIDERKTSLSRM